MPNLRYKCVFPNCSYETDNRSLIEFHHIHPRELGVKLNQNVTIPLCPTHHKMIYHPDATSGQHAIQHPDSMSVVQIATTNTGKCVIFKDSNGTEITVYMDMKDTGNSDIYCMSWDLVNGIRNSLSDIEDTYIEQNVDKVGYYQSGSKVYYNKSHLKIASDLLAAYVAQYMTKTKTEYASVLDRARADWKILHNAEV